MKAGAKPFKKGYEESAERIHEVTAATRRDIDSLRHSLNNIVDVIAEDDPQNRGKIISALKENMERNRQPASYKIQIVYTKDYADIADDLRQTLNKQGNAASMQTKEDYKTNNYIADYYIMLGCYSDATDEVTHLLDVAGCQIDQLNKHIYVYESQIGDVVDGLSDAEWKKFIDYYTSETSREFEQEKELQKANKIREKKQRRSETKIADSILEASDRRLSGLFNAIDFTTDHLPPILDAAVAVPLFIVSFADVIVSGIFALPVGIAESVVNGVLNSLETRDTKAINQAQRQILLIKTCEYIRQQQVINAR
jgi:hypothetical protein